MTHRRGDIVTGREWRAVLLYTLFILFITTLPYVAAWAGQGDEWRFTGFLFGVEDGHSYLGKMRLGARGLWDFYLFYTPEPHDPVPLVFLPYIVPGQIVGLFMDSTDPALSAALALTFHILRVIFDALLIFTLYRFIAAFLRSPGARLLALVLATLGGGLGWLVALAGIVTTPPEFYIPEGFSFLILLGLPHLALSRAAMLGGLLALLASTERERWLPSALLAGGLWLVVGLAVPFYLVIVYVILGAWGLAAWIRTRAFPTALAIRCVVAAGLTLPMFAYFALAFSSNPAFARWSAQNQLPSPPVLHYLLAYLVLLLPALVGLRWAWRRARWRLRYALLVGWLLVVLPLLYLPVNVQRRMAEGVIVPLAILAAGGVHAWARGWALRQRGRSSGRRLRRAAWVLGIVASLSAALFWLGSFLAAGNPQRPLFRPVDELAAFAWLNQHAAPDDVVLASVLTGNALPAFTNQRPYMGHGPETLDWPAKTEDVERFFGGEMRAEEQAALFSEYDIRYVFYGPLERALLPDSTEPPAWEQGLTQVYEAGAYRVYGVR